MKRILYAVKLKKKRYSYFVIFTDSFFFVQTSKENLRISWGVLEQIGMLYKNDTFGGQNKSTEKTFKMNVLGIYGIVWKYYENPSQIRGVMIILQCAHAPTLHPVERTFPSSYIIMTYTIIRPHKKEQALRLITLCHE